MVTHFPFIFHLPSTSISILSSSHLNIPSHPIHLISSRKTPSMQSRQCRKVYAGLKAPFLSAHPENPSMSNNPSQKIVIPYTHIFPTQNALSHISKSTKMPALPNYLSKSQINRNKLANRMLGAINFPLKEEGLEHNLIHTKRLKCSVLPFR